MCEANNKIIDCPVTTNKHWQLCAVRLSICDSFAFMLSRS